MARELKSKNKLVAKSQKVDTVSLIEQNIALTEEVYQLTKKVHNSIVFSRIVAIIQLVLFIAPLIMAFIYLPPMFKEFLGEYKSLVNQSNNSLNVLK
ncbi:MAG: hypothetical protein PHR00_01615 [Patescibacteria group bacterium]|nr:hypothetical protein [Patescibacteria group bacterium]